MLAPLLLAALASLALRAFTHPRLTSSHLGQYQSPDGTPFRGGSQQNLRPPPTEVTPQHASAGSYPTQRWHGTYVWQ